METAIIIIENLILGFLIGLLFIWIYKSTYMPRAMWIQSIKFLEKPEKYIENIDSKIFDPHGQGLEQWNLIDRPVNEKKQLNLYFFPWPLYKVHKHKISYTKILKPGEEKEGDIILRKKYDETKTEVTEILISRTRMSDHLLFREGYPMLTPSLSTLELGNINVITDPVLEIINPAKALYGIANWLERSMNFTGAALRGFVADKNLADLNKLSSEGGSGVFSEEIKGIVNTNDDIHPGLGNIGVKLYKYAFIDFDPIDEKTKRLMESYTDVVITTKEGEALVIKTQKEAIAQIERATAEAQSYGLNQEQIVAWRKKFLVDTGLAKIDANGNIIKLIPDANLKIAADAIKALSKVTGTLVLDSGTLNKMLTINPEKKAD